MQVIQVELHMIEPVTQNNSTVPEPKISDPLTSGIPFPLHTPIPKHPHLFQGKNLQALFLVCFRWETN